MGIKIKNEAGGQWHGLVTYIFESADDTACQENITCWVLNNWTKVSGSGTDLDSKVQFLSANINTIADEICDSKFPSQVTNKKHVKMLHDTNQAVWKKDWLVSYIYQAESWSKFVGIIGDYKYYQHDVKMTTTGTIAEAVQKAANVLKVSKDTFQKADIYAIANTFNEKKAVESMYAIIDSDSDVQVKAQEISSLMASWVTNKEVYPISLKKLKAEQVINIYNMDNNGAAGHNVDLDFKFAGLDRVLAGPEKGWIDSDKLTGERSSKPKNGELPSADEHIHKSSEITYTMSDHIVVDDKVKEITRKLKLNLRSGDFQKCSLFVEMGANGKVVMADSKKELNVPDAQLGKLGSWLNQFIGSDGGKKVKLRYGQLKDAVNELNGTALMRISGYGQLNIRALSTDEELRIKEDLSMSQEKMSNYGKWYTLAYKMVQAYIGLNTALLTLIDKAAKRGEKLTEQEAFAKILVYTYLSAKGINNDMQLICACPYILIGT